MQLKDLGDRIRSQREKQGLRQQDIASALQLSPQAVSKWERGENAPDLALLVPLARLLGVSTDYLLGATAEGKDTFEATVFVSDIHGAYEKSLGLPPRDFAVWINGLLNQMTEAVLRFDAVPVKYAGDALLAFFSGARHAERAVEAALATHRIVSEGLRVGLSSGTIYLGSVGHPHYARPDILGETVNLAFLTKDWADANTKSGMAATASVIEQCGEGLKTGKAARVNFKGIARPVELREIQR
jgi:class 3 adenylate cyclase